MHIRRLLAHEVGLHRQLRLQALQESPDSFDDVFAEIAARPASYWDELTRSVTEPGRHVMFLACDGDGVVGSSYGLLDGTRSDAARVGGLWVDSAHRRRGVGLALVEAVIAWAGERGLSPVSLWAPEHSPAARALYRRAGFRETGRRRAFPRDAARQIVEMERGI